MSKEKKFCRLCGNDKFNLVIDYGMNPLVNSLLTKEECGTEKTYRLLVEQCKSCYLVQIVNPIDSHKIYQDQDYIYYTGDMPQNSQYMKSFDSLVSEIQNQYSKEGDFLVEIGSNDGTILKKFSDRKVLGVDPSTNVVIRALAHNIPTISAPFNERIAKNIAKEFGKAQVIGGANCLAHIDDIHGVLRGVVALLAQNGVFWVECNYWGGMVKHNNYALIYHDHYSYFTLQNWVDLLAMHGLEIFDAYVTEAQGDGLSLRLYADNAIRVPTKSFLDLLEEEKKTKLNNSKVCNQFLEGVTNKAKELKKIVVSIKESGKSIAGYGAAAKGFSILKLAEIDEKHIDYFVDDSPAKQGKYTPVSHIPVISRQAAENRLPDYFFITAPNYATVIIEKEQNFLDKGGKFLLESSEIVG